MNKQVLAYARDSLKISSAFALCPLDGRYWEISEKLFPYFSEYALVAHRVEVEVYWLLYLCKNVESKLLNDVYNSNPKEVSNQIVSIYTDFGLPSFLRVKEFEKTLNHDVKAVELYVSEQLEKKGLERLKSFVHIGCTSEDISNVAYGLMISKALQEVWIPTAEKLIEVLELLSVNFANLPMLAHTHGQPATPTTVGKELKVFAFRLKKALAAVKEIEITAKFSGATGNYAAMDVAFPNENWEHHAIIFIEEYIGLSYNPVTTQIESHDYVCSLADAISRFNNIVVGFDWDMWLYICLNYFAQEAKTGEVGSSTMPHKVNPIKFENSLANAGVSTAIFRFLSQKLSSSRLQRDLSDSSTQRNIGMAFGYSLLAIENTLNGLKRVHPNEMKLKEDLEQNYAVLAEPIQTMLRKYGNPEAYNTLKELTRGKEISKENIEAFIQSLDALSVEDKEMLLSLSPSDYTGYAAQICYL